jgi:hypothetical protein
MRAEQFLASEENKTGLSRASRLTWEAMCEFAEAYAASLADSPSPTAPTDEERDFYALLRGICEDVIDWLGTLSYDNVTDHRNILDHRLTKELNGKLQKMYKHPLDDKVLRRTDELEHLLRSPSGTAAETKTEASK